MSRNTKAGVRIAIGSDFDPKGFLAAEERTARLRELQLAESGTMAGAWVQAGHGMMTFGSQVETVGRNMATLGGSLTRNVTLPIVGIGGAAIAASVEFESAFAGVTKTVDGTAAELDGIKQGIRDMAMELPASREEISNVAAAAGQLGIETPRILDFTRVMIDLGVSTSLSAEEGATALARFANITQMSQDNFSNLGSSIVALGNNMATTETEIADFALRIAGAGMQVGLTEPQILAIGAALSSVGIDAEAGGTAISKTMIGIESAVQSGGDQLDLWAQTAGMSAEQFAAAWESDPATALNSVVQGLANMEAQGGSTLQQLELLGITEVRQRDALLRAAGAGDLLTQALQISGQAWEENSALAEEAGKRYGATESQWKILLNRLGDVGVEIGDVLVPALMDAVEAAEPMLETVRELAQQFSELDPQQQQQIMKWVALAAVMGPVLSGLGQMAITTSSVINVAGQAHAQIGKMAAQIGGLNGHVAAATSGMGAMSASTAMASAGYVALAGAAGFAIGSLINQIPIVAEKQREWGEAIGESIAASNAEQLATDEVVASWKAMGIQLDENNNITEEGVAQLERMNAVRTGERLATDDATAALFNYRNELSQVLDLQMGAERADIALERAKIRLEDAQVRYNEAIAQFGPESTEAERAALDLRDATLGLEDAQVRSAAAQQELTAQVAAMPRPDNGTMIDWLNYYQAIGDEAAYAALQAGIANQRFMDSAQGIKAKSGTGGYNIPMGAGGGLFTGPDSGYIVMLHGDEVALPLGDQNAAEKYLPALLASLGQAGRPATVVTAASAPAYAPQSASDGIGGGDINVTIVGSQRSYSGQLRALRDIKRGLVTV